MDLSKVLVRLGKAAVDSAGAAAAASKQPDLAKAAAFGTALAQALSADGSDPASATTPEDQTAGPNSGATATPPATPLPGTDPTGADAGQAQAIVLEGELGLEAALTVAARAGPNEAVVAVAVVPVADNTQPSTAPTTTPQPSTAAATSSTPVPTAVAKAQSTETDSGTLASNVLNLALATAMATWVDRALGAQGSQQVVTVGGQHVGSLASDIPAALRQAVEATLADLDSRGAKIPPEVMAGLEAIRDAVTVDTPTVLSGPVPTASVTQFASSLTDVLLNAVAQRNTDPTELLRLAVDALGRSEPTAGTPAASMAASDLFNLLASRAQAAVADAPTDLQAAVDALLAALRGRLVSSSDTTATAPAPSSVAPAPAETTLPATATPSSPSEPVAGPLLVAAPGPGSTAPAAGVTDAAVAQPANEPEATAAVLSTTPVSDLGTAPAYAKSRAELAETIAATLQAPGGRTPNVVAEQVGIPEAGETLASIGVGEARELGPLLAAPTPIVLGRASASSVGEPVTPASDPGTMVVQGADGKGATLSGEGLARLLGLLDGKDSAVAQPRKPAAATVSSASANARSDAAPAVLGAVPAPATTDAGSGGKVTLDDPTRAVQQAVLTEVDRAVHQAAATGQREVVFELKPPYLGDLRVTIRASEQAVSAQFQAQSHTVKALLESNMHLLRDMLHDAGFSTDRIEVSVASGGAGDGGAFYRGDAEARRVYQALTPKVPQAVDETTYRPYGSDVGSAYGLASVVDVLA